MASNSKKKSHHCRNHHCCNNKIVKNINQLTVNNIYNDHTMYNINHNVTITPININNVTPIINNVTLINKSDEYVYNDMNFTPINNTINSIQRCDQLDDVISDVKLDITDADNTLMDSLFNNICTPLNSNFVINNSLNIDPNISMGLNDDGLPYTTIQNMNLINDNVNKTVLVNKFCSDTKPLESVITESKDIQCNRPNTDINNGMSFTIEHDINDSNKGIKPTNNTMNLTEYKHRVMINGFAQHANDNVNVNSQMTTVSNNNSMTTVFNDEKTDDIIISDTNSDADMMECVSRSSEDLNYKLYYLYEFKVITWNI
eukprot:62363_1